MPIPKSVAVKPWSGEELVGQVKKAYSPGMSGSKKSDVIKGGDYIILKNRQTCLALRVSNSGNVSVYKSKVKLNSIIGHQFGQKYEIKNNTIKRFDFDPIKSSSGNDMVFASSNKDNRNIVDDGASQKLSRSDIEELKAEGLTGNEIVENLIENSSTFKDKTEFSQQKYRNKKKNKYENIYTIYKPTLRHVVEMYYQNSPSKILYLRIDSLSQMLAMCNVVSGARYVVFDTCFGLLTAAVLLRLGVNGSIIQLHSSDLPPRNIVEMLNFTENELKNLSSLPIHHLLKEIDCIKSADDKAPPEPPEKRLKVEDDKDETDEQMSQTTEKLAENRKSAEKLARRLKRHADWEISKSLLENKNLDGLLIASKHDPNECVMDLAEYIMISRPVVVFCPYKEPLIQCYKRLKDSGNFINLKLTETWLRSYQILNERSHPEINMSSSGGYILSGIKISNKIE